MNWRNTSSISSGYTQLLRPVPNGDQFRGKSAKWGSKKISTFKMPIEIEQKTIESNSNPTLNHLMLCSSEIEANTLTLASLGF